VRLLFAQHFKKNIDITPTSLHENSTVFGRRYIAIDANIPMLRVDLRKNRGSNKRTVRNCLWKH
jgi:hypothetical protein